MADSTHEHRLRVRYSETDQMGIAHHASYLVYLEEGRTRMLEELGCSYAKMERKGFGLPVRRIELRYRASAFFDDVLVIRTRLSEVRTASVSFDYEVVRPGDDDDETVLATGWTELACVDLSSAERRLIPLPESLRRTLS